MNALWAGIGLTIGLCVAGYVGSRWLRDTARLSDNVCSRYEEALVRAIPRLDAAVKRLLAGLDRMDESVGSLYSAIEEFESEYGIGEETEDEYQGRLKKTLDDYRDGKGILGKGTKPDDSLSIPALRLGALPLEESGYPDAKPSGYMSGRPPEREDEKGAGHED